MYAGHSLFAVADGMGGHPAGDIASATAIDALRPFDRHADPAELTSVLGSAVKAANDALRTTTAVEPKTAGMGTTLVALKSSGTTAALANVGDSRAYLLRHAGVGAGNTVQITEDHTYGHLVTSAAVVPQLHRRLSRWLDGRVDGRSPDITIWALRPGDRFLLCSDGLSSLVPMNRIDGALKSLSDPTEAADRLIALALEYGGPDNITAVVIDVHVD